MTSKTLTIFFTLFVFTQSISADTCRAFNTETIIKHAKGFNITYTPTTKRIEILNPWHNADVVCRFLLVQRGCKTPPEVTSDSVIVVPVNRIVSLSSTHISNLDDLGLLSDVVGIGDARWIYNPKIHPLVKQGNIAEVGWSSSLDIERLLSLKPDLVLTFAIGQPGMDDLDKLKQYQIPYVLIAEYLEETPLGRAEWIKLMAAFSNKEVEADRIFTEIETRYLNLVRKVRNLKKPRVFTGTEYKGIWKVPGGQSYVAGLLKDAGTDYIWANNKDRGSLTLDFEAIYAKAWNSEFWLHPGTCNSIDDLLNIGSRYTLFQAVKNGKVYNNNARQNSFGGNDYWDTGLARPHLLLADLVSIFHPKVMPDHQLIWYKRLK